MAKKAALEQAARARQTQQEQEQAALERSTQERAAKKAELGERKAALQAQLQAVRGALEGVVGERKRLWRENEEHAAAIEAVTAAAEKERRELGRLVCGWVTASSSDARRRALRADIGKLQQGEDLHL